MKIKKANQYQQLYALPGLSLINFFDVADVDPQNLKNQQKLEQKSKPRK